jgi:Ser/Thr protein kinase RdoA (MazF antagonist)
MRPRETADLVFCHNDLSANNVIVDPETLNIRAIIDWEYSGFFPAEFEARFYTRPGPSVALKGEANDERALKDIMTREKA